MNTAHQTRKLQHSEEGTWTQSTARGLPGHPWISPSLLFPLPLATVSRRAPVPLSGLGPHKGSDGAEVKWTRNLQTCESLTAIKTGDEDAELEAGIPDNHT